MRSGSVASILSSSASRKSEYVISLLTKAPKRPSNRLSGTRRSALRLSDIRTCSTQMSRFISLLSYNNHSLVKVLRVSSITVGNTGITGKFARRVVRHLPKNPTETIKGYYCRDSKDTTCYQQIYIYTAPSLSYFSLPEIMTLSKTIAIIDGTGPGTGSAITHRFAQPNPVVLLSIFSKGHQAECRIRY